VPIEIVGKIDQQLTAYLENAIGRELAQDFSRSDSPRRALAAGTRFAPRLPLAKNVALP
jgi:hypothetical protein